MLIAGDCVGCMQCSVGSCVIGSATQDPEHVKRYEIEKRALQMHHFLEALNISMASGRERREGF